MENKKKLILFKYIILFIFTIIIIINYSYKSIISNNNIYKDSCLIHFNSKIYKNLIYQYLKLFDIKYTYSFIYKKIKIEYNIEFYNRHKEFISPSDLLLFNNFQLICHINITNSNISIDSLATIYQNKFYQCIEFFNLNETIEIGIKITQITNHFYNKKLIFFNHNFFNYNNLINKNDKIFDPLFINKQYFSLINYNKTNTNLKLVNIYKKYPNCTLKRNSSIIYNNWTFNNIYNIYYCFCKGNNCSNIIIPQRCKYLFYVNIIDNNSNVYQKTDFLFVDFISSRNSADDTYPIFEEMEKTQLPVHYLTAKRNIYNKYCNNKKKCLIIIYINFKFFKTYGDFVEKYLILFLKLKAVISCKVTNFSPISSIFYHSEYITYIAVGHGVCYFKPFLYNPNRLYGKNKNNKILLPPSDRIISMAKEHGWKDEDIIKINLPRWDKFNKNNDTILNLKNETKITNNSIFMMFTWRGIKRNKSISQDYIKNISNLLINDKLYKKLKEKNISLYFTVHRYIRKKIYKYIVKGNKNIKLIGQNEISDCLMKSSLVVSDFSSIIFDLICRKKPFIMYIPDGNDPKLKYIYTRNYYWIIKSIKKGKFKFKNIYFNFNKAIKKIIFYINNGFKLESSLKKFYKSFGFNSGKNIELFIKYLKGLK